MVRLSVTKKWENIYFELLTSDFLYMFFFSFSQIIKFALQNFWRNIWLSLVTITMLILTLFSVTSLFFINILANKAIETIQTRIDMSIYFKNDVTEAKAQEIKDYLENLREVKEVKYLPKEQALEEFKTRHANDSLILKSLEELSSNPLGSVLIVKAAQPEDYSNIMSKLEDEKYNYLIEKKDFDDHKAIISRISDLNRKIRQAIIAISLFFGLIAVLVIFNTIRMAIYSHRHEIGIMKLVGASNWFVRGPFLMEGVIYALVACAITAVLWLPFLNLIQPYLETFFGDTSFNLYNYFLAHLWPILGLQFLIAVVLNMFSTLIAINKYLEV